MRVNRSIGDTRHSRAFTFLIRITFQTFLPHGGQINQMIREAQIFLGNLKLGHNRCLFHGAEQRTKRFARLKINRSVFHLNNHVIMKLPVEWHKLLICLLGTILISGIIHKSPPHNNTLMRFQSLGKHIGSIGMRTPKVLRTGQPFGVSFH
ncbi:hypothetical protein SDC9_139845 [bioreactor metagenome]|uniref:Uncharacterized protein n=1 Tax=bioreactor metagenome TaxID=1076179 RepID=A0A645DT94_9ZZZZ